MTVDPTRSYRRWQAAEADGRDDEADAEFAVVFGTVPQPGVGASFTARTMEAVAAAAAKEARRARQTRIATLVTGLIGGIAAVYFGAGLLVSLVSTVMTRGFDLLIGAVVRMAGAAQTGADLWSVVTSMGRAAVAFAADPTVTMMLFALQGIAVAALIVLQRLLGTDEESLK
jgi:hypothetical protein